FTSLCDQGLQVFTFDEVHRDELRIRLSVFAHIKDADNILVDDRLGEQYFLLETLERRRSSCHFRKDRLQSNETSELAVESSVHRYHTADSQQVDDLIPSC